MSYRPDLDAYCQRIGYTGPRTASLPTLRALVLAHVQAIPFENLDVLLGRGIRLEPEAIEQKLVHEGRGGYCFEQNSLLLHVLTALGFQAAPISARVRVQRARDFTPPRTHVFVLVVHDGERWLCDVGVGALSPSAPLGLDVDGEQTTPHEPRRILRDGGWTGLDHRDPAARIFHQVKLGGEWNDVCEFTLEAMPEIDREVANWFTSTHPHSHFRNRLMAARATATGRMTLLNREFTVRDADGTAHKEVVRHPAHLLELLRQHFALHFPGDTRFDCPALDWTAAGG